MDKVAIIGGTGFIGSSLFRFLQAKGYEVETVDLELFGNAVNPANLAVDYSILPPIHWRRYGTIILLAGIANVRACSNDMAGTFRHNVANFVDLLGKIPHDQKLIYASTSNIYGMTGATEVKETHDRFSPVNHYDLSKKVIDMYAQVRGGRYYSLRLATVNGASPNLRVDVMINKMFHDAKVTGAITIMNPKVNRPILGLSDLCRAVLGLIENDVDPGIYNLASFNANVQTIAETAASHFGGMKVINAGNSPTYDFAISTEKFRTALDFTFADSIGSIIDSIKEVYDSCLHTVR